MGYSTMSCKSYLGKGVVVIWSLFVSVLVCLSPSLSLSVSLFSLFLPFLPASLLLREVKQFWLLWLYIPRTQIFRKYQFCRVQSCWQSLNICLPWNKQTETDKQRHRKRGREEETERQTKTQRDRVGDRETKTDTERKTETENLLTHPNGFIKLLVHIVTL